MDSSDGGLKMLLTNKCYMQTSFTTLFRLLTCSFFLICLAATAFGQTTWSDTWLVGPAPDSNNYESEPFPELIPGAYFRGAGITDDYYNSYGHEYSVYSTLTSPNGRTDVAGGSGGTHASADVSLQLRTDEQGNFVIDSLH